MIALCCQLIAGASVAYVAFAVGRRRERARLSRYNAGRLLGRDAP